MKEIKFQWSQLKISGIDDIIIITGRGKHSIEDHFDIAFELEYILKENKKFKELKEIRKISELADIQYIRQKNSLGLGHAILCAEKHIGNEPFAVLLGDDVVFSKEPCTKQLIKKYKKYKSSIIAVEPVPENRIETYGIIKYSKPVEDHLYPLIDLVEKPKKKDAPSNLGILGRYILSPDVFDCIKKTKPGYGGEIQLTDGLRILNKKKRIYAYEFYGKRYDLGNKMDWLKTTFDVALMREEFRDEILKYIKNKIREEKL